MDYSLSTCLEAHREPHKTILPIGLERQTERIQRGSKKKKEKKEGGWRDKDGDAEEDVKRKEAIQETIGRLKSRMEKG